MKTIIGVIFLIAVLIALTEFAIWNECRMSPSPVSCGRVSR